MAPDAFATVCRRNEDMGLEDMDLAVVGNDADVARLQTTTTVVFFVAPVNHDATYDPPRQA
jgi:hypothetical protein